MTLTKAQRDSIDASVHWTCVVKPSIDAARKLGFEPYYGGAVREAIEILVERSWTMRAYRDRMATFRAHVTVAEKWHKPIACAHCGQEYSAREPGWLKKHLQTKHGLDWNIAWNATKTAVVYHKLMMASRRVRDVVYHARNGTSHPNKTR